MEGNLNNDVNHMIDLAGWIELTSVTGILCYHTIPIKVKGKFF